MWFVYWDLCYVIKSFESCCLGMKKKVIWCSREGKMSVWLPLQGLMEWWYSINESVTESIPGHSKFKGFKAFTDNWYAYPNKPKGFQEFSYCQTQSIPFVQDHAGEPDCGLCPFHPPKACDLNAVTECKDAKNVIIKAEDRRGSSEDLLLLMPPIKLIKAISKTQLLFLTT